MAQEMEPRDTLRRAEKLLAMADEEIANLPPAHIKELVRGLLCRNTMPCVEAAGWKEPPARPEDPSASPAPPPPWGSDPLHTVHRANGPFAGEETRLPAMLLDQIGDFITVTDLEGRITYVNETVARSMGLPREALIGRTVRSYGEDPQQGATQGEIIETTLRTGRWRGLVWNTVRDGEKIALSCRTRLVRDGQSRPVGMVGVSTDVTDLKRSETALREIKRKLEFALTTARMGIWDWDVRTGRVDWYGEHASLFGTTMAAFGGTIEDVQGYVHPDDREQGMDLFQRVVEEEMPFDNTYRVVWPDGSVRWMHSYGRLIRDDKGEPERIIGTTRDITARRKAEIALLEKTRELDRFFENSLDLLAIADTDGHFRRLNPEWERALGYPAGELEGIRFLDLVHPDDVAPTLEAIATLSGQETILNFENRYRHRDGTYRWIEWRSHPEGEMIYACARDVTERRRTEEALAENERRYRTLWENFPNGVLFLFDRNLRYLYCDGQGLAKAGLRKEEIIGRTVRELWTKEMCAVIEPHCRAIFQEGRSGTYEVDFRGRRYDNLVFPVFREDGSIQEGLCVTRDITRQRELEERFQQAQRLESVGRLAAGVAHDLNNLLSPVLGYAEILMEDLSDPEPLGKVREIVKAAQGSRDLIRQLLAFGRKQILEVTVVDLREVVRETVGLLRRTLRENIALEIHLAASPCAVTADRGQLAQVLTNLAVNAEDAMPDGGTLTIEVGVTRLDEAYCKEHTGAQPGEHAMLAVSDTGLGMDDEIRAHIFEPFFTTKNEKGTGLGLATVYGIVKQHGGNIWVYTEPVRGTTFKVYLPATEAAAQERPAKPAPAAETSPGGETVLVVEDNEMVRNLASAVLRRQGYTVLSAAEGRRAMDLLAAHAGPVHLLLTDVVMPDMDGRDLSRRAAVHYPDLKVLFMSGYTENVIARHGVLDEGVHFIQKPFSIRSLAGKVREILNG